MPANSPNVPVTPKPQRRIQLQRSPRKCFIGRMQDAPEVSPQIVRTPRRSRLRSPAIALSLVPLCPSCRLVPLALLFFFFAPRTCQPISRNPSFSSAPREEGVYHRTGSCGRQRLPFDTKHYRAHTVGEPDRMRGRNSSHSNGTCQLLVGTSS